MFEHKKSFDLETEESKFLRKKYLQYINKCTKKGLVPMSFKTWEHGYRKKYII